MHNNKATKIDINHDLIETAIVDYQQVYFSVAEVAVDRLAGIMEFTILLSEASLSQETSVDYLLGKIAAADIDSYEVDSGTLIFSPGVTSYTVTLSFSDIDYKQCDSDFDIVLTNSVNAKVKEGFGWVYDKHNQHKTTADIGITNMG